MQALFLPPAPGSAGGARFAMLHRPAGDIQGMVVYVHPFAEEMNKSRRMAAMTARALADRGLAVLLPDLLGCGDSPGDFGDASWASWVDDIVQASRWLRQNVGHPVPLTLWGLRAGALLAAEAAARLGDVQRLLLWQPSISGKTVLQQFLRLQVAGDMLGGDKRAAAETPKARLAAGHAVDLAGYRIAPALASGLDQARLLPVPGVLQVHWLEVSSREDAALTPAATDAVAAWRQAGCEVQTQLVTGPAFWQTTETEDAPGLITATVAALGAEAARLPAAVPQAVPA